MWPLGILYLNSVWWCESLCVRANGHFMRYNSVTIKVSCTECSVLRTSIQKKKNLIYGLECYHPPIHWIIAHCLRVSKGIPYCHIPTFPKPLHYLCIFGNPENFLFAGWFSLVHLQNICWTTTCWWEKFFVCTWDPQLIFVFSKNGKCNPL